MAHLDLVLRSKASTTLPNVPWPSNLWTWSGERQHEFLNKSLNTSELWKSLTSVPNRRIICHDVVTIIVINLLMSGVVLVQRQQIISHRRNGIFTSLIEGTWTSLALIGGFGGGT